MCVLVLVVKYESMKKKEKKSGAPSPLNTFHMSNIDLAPRRSLFATAYTAAIPYDFASAGKNVIPSMLTLLPKKEFSLFLLRQKGGTSSPLSCFFFSSLS